MTGTAQTEEKEFRNIYQMDVIEIPTNRPVIRIDHRTTRSIRRRKRNSMRLWRRSKKPHAKGQPVLVGTITMETSELLSQDAEERGHPA